MIPLAKFIRTTPFYVIAHRGASGDAPENTLSSIQMAISEGALMIEMDVQTTLDKELVVFHDSVLGRTTNGHGYVQQTPLSEIRTLDAGSWFNEKFARERVPLVGEALDMIQGHCYLNLKMQMQRKRCMHLLMQSLNVKWLHTPYSYHSITMHCVPSNRSIQIFTQLH